MPAVRVAARRDRRWRAGGLARPGPGRTRPWPGDRARRVAAGDALAVPDGRSAPSAGPGCAGAAPADSRETAARQAVPGCSRTPGGGCGAAACAAGSRGPVAAAQPGRARSAPGAGWSRRGRGSRPARWRPGGVGRVDDERRADRLCRRAEQVQDERVAAERRAAGRPSRRSPPCRGWSSMPVKISGSKVRSAIGAADRVAAADGIACSSAVVNAASNAGPFARRERAARHRTATAAAPASAAARARRRRGLAPSARPAASGIIGSRPYGWRPARSVGSGAAAAYEVQVVRADAVDVRCRAARPGRAAVPGSSPRWPPRSPPAWRAAAASPVSVARPSPSTVPGGEPERGAQPRGGRARRGGGPNSCCHSGDRVGVPVARRSGRRACSRSGCPAAGSPGRRCSGAPVSRPASSVAASAGCVRGPHADGDDPVDGVRVPGSGTSTAMPAVTAAA